jgi:hypothetical protein
MRHPDYVSDGMEVLKWPPPGNVRKVYAGVAEMRFDAE